MAAITLTVPTLDAASRRVYTVRSGTAQADTGQVDWIRTPQGCVAVVVDFNMTASAGTTPVTDLRVLSTDPVSMDDTYLYDVGGTTLTAQSSTGATVHQVVEIGPGITGIADDLVLGATGFSRAAINAAVPAVLGLKLVFDRTSANETYTYTLSVTFTRARAR